MAAFFRSWLTADSWELTAFARGPTGPFANFLFFYLGAEIRV